MKRNDNENCVGIKSSKCLWIVENMQVERYVKMCAFDVKYNVHILQNTGVSTTKIELNLIPSRWWNNAAAIYFIIISMKLEDIARWVLCSLIHFRINKKLALQWPTLPKFNSVSKFILFLFFCIPFEVAHMLLISHMWSLCELCLFSVGLASLAL